jgi:hypothetical protein
LLAHGTDAKKVYDDAREQGITAPYLEQVSPKQEKRRVRRWRRYIPRFWQISRRPSR